MRKMLDHVYNEKGNTSSGLHGGTFNGAET